MCLTHIYHFTPKPADFYATSTLSSYSVANCCDGQVQGRADEFGTRAEQVVEAASVHVECSQLQRAAAYNYPNVAHLHPRRT